MFTASISVRSASQSLLCWWADKQNRDKVEKPSEVSIDNTKKSKHTIVFRCDFTTDCTDGSDERYCVECDFEEDTCGYTDISSGKYKWLRENITIITDPNGPQTDGSGNING